MKDVLIKKASRSRGVIFGEYHTPEERDRIEKLILQTHERNPYQFILSEEVGEGVYLTQEAIRKAIAGKLWSISDRTYQLCLKLGLPAVGIDNWDKQIYRYDAEGHCIDARHSFSVREARMVNVISEYLQKGRITVIVGDSHLRKTTTAVLGKPSPLWQQWYADKSVCIIRSPKGEVV